MQLGLSFSLLLASLLFSLSSGVQAAPAKRGAGMVTLPLKRIHQVRDDIHPQVVSTTNLFEAQSVLTRRQLLQQHINRGLKRYARMTGREQPSKRELEENMEKRLYLPASGPGSRKPAKRYNRHGAGKGSDLATGGKNKKGKAAKGAA